MEYILPLTSYEWDWSNLYDHKHMERHIMKKNKKKSEEKIRDVYSWEEKNINGVGKKKKRKTGE